MFTFVNMILNSQITNWYSKHFETRLSGRYIGSKHINPILFEYQKLGLVEVLGNSEKGEKIHLIKVGHGSKKFWLGLKCMEMSRPLQSPFSTF